ncbi:hypothetical protein [Bacillus altitudinis]|uniref:hypothetical protein n=1 Tax=Bacillus altitudinis TaxID=293387 RepID=UPI00069EE010|nr:hypothetical protein [Bacillus altitudinis]
MDKEELYCQLMHMKNAIVALHDHLAPEFRTRDLTLLKYSFTQKQILELEDYFMQITMEKSKVSKEDFRKKLAEIKGLPHLTKEVAEEVLLSYKSDGLHTKVINNILKK